MKNSLLKGVAAIAFTAGLVVAASTAASAETLPLPSASSASVTSTGAAQLVGTGYTDVSTLTIAGIVDPATGQITPTTPTQGKPGKVGVTPQIT